jgi:Response regulator containing CheY-like receiver, AAA-type ATPase, and DNA-binding domains
VIAATHQDLEALVQQGRFRADLLHRLNVVRLQIPALRERRGDIPLLATTFLHRASRKLGGGAKRFEPAALAALQAMDWPGNVRELQNLCWRLAALAPGETITLEDLQVLQAPVAAPPAAPASAAQWDMQLRQWALDCLRAGARDLHAEARERFDRALLNAALEHTGGRRVEAAALLGVGRNTVTRKLGPGRRRER